MNGETRLIQEGDREPYLCRSKKPYERTPSSSKLIRGASLYADCATGFYAESMVLRVK